MIWKPIGDAAAGVVARLEPKVMTLTVYDISAEPLVLKVPVRDIEQQTLLLKIKVERGTP